MVYPMCSSSHGMIVGVWSLVILCKHEDYYYRPIWRILRQLCDCKGPPAGHNYGTELDRHACGKSSPFDINQYTLISHLVYSQDPL